MSKMPPLSRIRTARQFFRSSFHVRISRRTLARFSAPAPPTSRPSLSPDNSIRIIEVGPRDGLQNEKTLVPLTTRIGLIERLAETGLRDIEAGSFVKPEWVPQMANSDKILAYLLDSPPPAPHPINYPFLIPNLRGFERVMDVCKSPSAFRYVVPQRPREIPLRPQPSNCDPAAPWKPTQLSVFISATETFSHKNLNKTTDGVLRSIKSVTERAAPLKIPIRAYISVVLGCPYEGPHVNPDHVANLAKTLLSYGCVEVSLGDTTGMGTPLRTKQLFEALKQAEVPVRSLAAHFHDTYGMALANCAIALEAGVRVFDSSVAGLGGCPYAKGATGNLATEELVYWAQSMGLDTGGVNLVKVAEVGEWISTRLGRENGSRVGKAVLAKVRDKGYRESLWMRPP